MSSERRIHAYHSDSIPEAVGYNIATGIFAPHSAFPGITVRASEGSKIIAFADNLSFAENPVPLESSANLLVSAADESNTTGGTTGSDSTGSSSGGGGGCSINGASGNELPLFGLAATVLLLAHQAWYPTLHQGQQLG